MSGFKGALEQRRRRQRRLYLGGAGVLLVGVLTLSLVMLFSHGTRITVTPPEAHIAVKGMGLVSGGTLYGLGRVDIEVSAQGYTTQSLEVEPGQALTVTLTGIPAGIVGRVHVEHGETRWRVGGAWQPLGSDGMLSVDLEPGLHRLEVDNPFYRQHSQTLKLRRAQRQTLEIHLAPAVGVLEIASTPSGASVFLEDEAVGTTPLRLERPAGSYTLRLDLADHQSLTETVMLKRPTLTVQRNYTLLLGQAWVDFDLNPPGGTLLLNGLVAPPSGPIEATVPVTAHYSKPGYRPATESLRLPAGAQRRVRFDLEAVYGEVSLNSTPPSEVWANGERLGTTPHVARLHSVPTTISWRKEGYRTVTRTITPKAAQRLDVELLPELQAQLNEAPPTVTNSLGMTLKLYQPGESFRLGSASFEEGHRANEYQRTVELATPFYAGLHEVTVQQYAALTPEGTGSAGGAEGAGGGGAKVPGSGQHPVTGVSWEEAARFCNRLSAREGLAAFYVEDGGRVVGFRAAANGYRLLSEAEWEWLARKAGRAQAGRFVWGDESAVPPKAANISDESAAKKGVGRFHVPAYDDGFGGVAPVGSFRQEPSGLYDQGGNVREWVHDRYTLTDPGVPLGMWGSATGGRRVIKGASFASGTVETLRPVFRTSGTKGDEQTGFRVGRSLYGEQP